MFELYTDRAARVFVLGSDEAKQRGDRKLDTKHLLLGLLRDAETPWAQAAEVRKPGLPVHEAVSIAVTALASLGVEPHQIRERFEHERAPAVGSVASYGSIPFSRGGRRVIRQTLLEARLLGDNYLCTGHLLLGLLWVPRGSAAKTLAELGITKRSVVREAVRSVEPERSGIREQMAALAKTNPKLDQDIATISGRVRASGS